MIDIKTLPFWRDYSANQDIADTPATVNVQVAKANGVVGVFARSSNSWTYKDPTFEGIYAQAGALNLYRSSYHTFSPGANIDNQLKIWYEQHPEIDVIPRVMSVEVNWNKLEPYRIAQEVWKCAEAIMKRDGVYPIIYTRKQLADLWLTPFWSKEQLNSLYWWLAQYDLYRGKEEDNPVIPPIGLNTERILWKQTADQIAGFPGEAESSHVDRDRWVSEVEMHKFISETWGGVAPPPTTNLEQRVQYLENLTGVINKDLEETHCRLLSFEEEQTKRFAGVALTLNQLKKWAHRHWWMPK